MSTKTSKKRKSSLQSQIIAFGDFSRRERSRAGSQWERFREKGIQPVPAKCAQPITLSEPTAVQMNDWYVCLSSCLFARRRRAYAIGHAELVYCHLDEIPCENAEKFPECGLIFPAAGRRIPQPAAKHWEVA
jgi:hypothetical protein